MSAAARSILRERKNWLVHELYVRRDFGACLRLIDEQLDASGGLSEYALYVKGMIRRQQGRITESLQLFQAALCLSPRNVRILKQVARSLQLLGKHRNALSVLEQAVVCGASEDWEVHHAKGVCYLFRRDLDDAINAFEEANSCHPHESTYLQLGPAGCAVAATRVSAEQLRSACGQTQGEGREGAKWVDAARGSTPKAHELKGDLTSALETYMEALESSPDSTELLTTVGLLYMRKRDTDKAFEFLGNSLTHDPRDPKTILAAGSIIQDHRDWEVALSKYRVAAARTPHNPHMWNNIGMCFFGLDKFIASVACLKRAAYLAPFEWIVQYNLGIVHLRTGQNASAFHHLSAAVQLNRRLGNGFHYLAVALGRLGDPDNAISMFERALKLDE
ncbi:BBS4 [Symbiodinium sp. KB8]|nr:BBS4 [Symbiodinium sp. KB8]